MDKNEQELYQRVRRTLSDWEVTRMKAEGVKRQFVAAFPPVSSRPIVLPNRILDNAGVKEISNVEREEGNAFESHQAAVKALREYRAK